MSRLKISDLSFCEVATDKDIEVKGGLSVSRSLTLRNLSISLLPKSLTFTPVNYTREKVYSGVEYSVEKLNNPTTGESGYLVSSSDGKSLSITLTSRNTGSLGTSVRSYSFAGNISETPLV
ncbi:hypothetical protein [Iningainema tapete]|uniref:Uncharacterized protein n=1 Tax=Iningainema tapete BLCC-T55 TaxID=2748662 RepID=A0A8J6XNG0_9CYAN|nr:hypothetical protein [Iningainema tapete]MBD2773632.1 hypothetical protein [Iningainema tapete BLCC-T55]